jgi:formylglycine-generating enzyme required for sulfatase activity
MWMALTGMILLPAVNIMGQAVITSFQGNGQLSWTNTVNPSAIYRVEWAPQAGGPWHSFTYQPIHMIDAFSNTVFMVSVPMFYRIVMTTNQIPQGMVWIDGGEFIMGDTEGVSEPSALPVHTNWISGFWMDEMEVTKALWDSVRVWATNHGYTFGPGSGLGKTNNHPVHTVNWYDCVKWCNARSQKEGLTPCYYTTNTLASGSLYTNSSVNVSNEWVNWTANGYRLPTEAEWEKAARAGRERGFFPWGWGTISHAQANYYATNAIPIDISPTQGYHPTYATGGYPYTSPAGSFPANAYGLHDMAGNVIEWCWDWHGSYSATNQEDPKGPESGTQRIMRGGCWGDTCFWAWCACRASHLPSNGLNGMGFRCVRGR